MCDDFLLVCRIRFVSLVGLCLAVVIPVVAHGQEEDEDYRKGLVVRYEQSGRPPVTTVVSRPLVVRDGLAPDSRLADGLGFRAEWSGLLETDGEGKYRFSAFVCGQLEIRLGDRVVLSGKRATSGWLIGPQLTLPYDWLECRITYRAPAQGAELRLFWEGPDFSLEPLPERVFSHAVEDSVDDLFAQGRALARAYRCSACHEQTGEARPLASPNLQHARHVLRTGWVRERLMQQLPTSRQLAPAGGRRMPFYGLSKRDANDIVAYLWAQSTAPKKVQAKWRPAPKKRKRKSQAASAEEQQAALMAQGERLVLTLGCLACHAVGDLGEPSLTGGPPLDAVATKRPASWFVNWLADPSAFHPDHRMPVFELTHEEGTAIAAWLARDTDSSRAAADERVPVDPDRIARGKKLFSQLGCANCHATSDRPATLARRPLTQPGAAGGPSCLDAGSRAPVHFAVAGGELRALNAWIHALSLIARESGLSGERLIREHNCLACHRRGTGTGIAATLAGIGEHRPDLAPRIPAMTPPPLDSVGDKLTDQALRDAIRRRGATLRHYLDVRMPTFRLDDAEVEAIVRYLVAADRIPPGHPSQQQPTLPSVDAVTLKTAGARLVTSTGFGCTSCHAVGGVLPADAPLNARGPELTHPASRIRPSWFFRWVGNPSRIVPRMEMPGVKVAVHGVLGENLQHQLAAVWEVLNLADFVPPAPNPVRTLRQRGVVDRSSGRSVFVTDVVRYDGKPWIKPLLIGLPNRHNVLFDLATARQQFWTTGDVARQRTEGKTWYWELAGAMVAAPKTSAAEIELRRGDVHLAPLRIGQFVTEFDELEHDLETGGIRVRYRLRFQLPDRKTEMIFVTQSWHALRDGAGGGGFVRRVEVTGVPEGWRVLFRPFAGMPDVKPGGGGREFRLPGPAHPVARVAATAAPPASREGWWLDQGAVEVVYRATVQVDRFPPTAEEPLKLEARELKVLPGFRATRLAFPEEIMPIALAWRPDGALVFGSLKGRVWVAEDRDGDGLEETLRPATDELAAPYGLAAGPGYVDVLVKYALLRMTDVDGDGRYDRYVTLASGWGHTTDYHDWAVGLPRDEQGIYYVALPCQQDDRTPESARYRGKVLRLIPRRPSPENPHRFRIEVISGGHRFPMGIARDREGALFVTDNQGNYNPFNELNHVRPGARYGFYNKLEKKQGLKAPTTPPAIKIPHPWTRSVNGISFLYTPKRAPRRRGFGVFEGDLVGCEFNERALVRLSLERVNGVYQGAAYPMSWPEPLEGPPLIGPVSCAVSPRGDLYVGCLRDSGWGGANNIGSIVQCRPVLEELPTGIAHVRIRRDGFQLELTHPADRRRAIDPRTYAVTSYTRIPTPAYGGPDKNRRSEPVAAVSLDKSGKSITLRLQQPLRPGYVYEFHVKNLTPHGRGVFFPAQAHYTVHEIPE